MNVARAIELYLKNAKPTKEEAKMMKEIEEETEKELDLIYERMIKEIEEEINDDESDEDIDVLYERGRTMINASRVLNGQCINNSASHVCGAGGSPCEY